MRRPPGVLPVVVVVGVLLLALPGTEGARAMGDRVNASTLTVVINDRSFQLSPPTVQAGKVTFVVRNAGTKTAQFVVIKTNRAPKALPMEGNRASEAGKKGEIAKIARGATKRITLTLAPGKYVLIGNQPGDYKRGQFAGLFSKPTGSAAGPQTTAVSVSMFEMGFKLSQTRVPYGTVIFTVKNDGKVEHDFSFGSRGGGTPLLKPGESAKLTVNFPQPGISKYTAICTVEGHYAAGMYGVLSVF